jgi:hypothetical protein
MHTATTATGRPLPGKSLPKNRPASLTSSAPRHPAAPKPHVTSELQCCVPARIDNDRRSPRKINRQPRRVESSVSHTKQTPAPPINRQQMRVLHPASFAGLATSRIAHPSISNRHNQHAAPAPAPTHHESLVTVVLIVTPRD